VPLEYRSQLTAPKRKIPFSFTTSKKQWKPATTLNGRPYVVGGVPRTPNPRELEFEGLLNGGNVTKVISLGGGKAESRLDPSSATLTAGRASTISSPLFLISADSPTSPTTSTHSPSRRSRFLPGGTMRKRSPAEYDALEFETRTMFANLSDDDLLSADDKDPRRSKSSMGHARRESKDDAWVDILVGAQRRLNDQSSDLRPSGTRRPVTRRSMSDPELAREEIAQALKEAGPVPPEDDDVRPSQDYTHDGTSFTDEDVYGRPEDRDDDMTAPRDSIESEDFEPMPHMRVTSQDDGSIPPNSPLTHSRSESGLLPPSLQLNVTPHTLRDPQTSASPSPTPLQPKVPGKAVSSLIEMYREREKESLSQSRLPVRSISLPASSSASSALSSPSTPSAPQPPPESTVPEAPEEDPFVGRVSPSAPRYVHGAPLHNVVEAPEEEDEEE
jgi:hypothetical protein